jgi:hypothetical protein
MKRLEGRKATWRKWPSSIVYAYGMITFVCPVRAFAAIAAGGALPWDTPLTTLQTELAGAGCPRDHDRGCNRYRHHVVGQRAWNRRAQDVLARVRWCLRARGDPTDDDTFPVGGALF